MLVVRFYRYSNFFIPLCVLLIVSSLLEEIITSNLAAVSLLKEIETREQKLFPLLPKNIYVTEPYFHDNPFHENSVLWGASLFFEGNCDSSEQELARLTREQPQLLVGSVWLGLVRLCKQDYLGAADALNKGNATSILLPMIDFARNYPDKNVVRFWISLAAKTEIGFATVSQFAREEFAIGNRDAAVELLTLFSESSPLNHTDLLRALALKERMSGNLPQAVSYYEMALEAEPQNVALLDEARDVLIDTNLFEKAYQVARKRAGLTEKDAQAYLNVARTARLMGDLEIAHKWAFQTKNLKPNWSPAYRELGEINCLKGDQVAALKEFDSAIALASSREQIKIKQALAECLYKLGNTSAAIEVMVKSLEEYGKEPELVGMYLRLGEWYTDLEEIALAKSLYQKAIGIWPTEHWHSRFEMRLRNLSDQ